MSDKQLLRRRQRTILTAGVLASIPVALVLAPSGASATMDTRWHTPPACVVATDLPSRVSSLMGAQPHAPVAISLGADRHGDAWTISLRMDDATRRIERTLEGRDCATLNEAVALVVAVQLDAMAVASAIPASDEPVAPSPEPPRSVPEPAGPAPAAPTPSPRPTATSPPSVPARTDVPAAAGRPPRSKPRATIGVGGAIEVGVLPRAAGALELSGGAAWPRARLELSGLASFGPPAVIESATSVGARFALLTGAVRGCGVLRRGRAELPLCGAFEVGTLRGRSTGITRPRAVNAPWVAITPGVRPQWSPVPRLALGGMFDLAVPLIRNQYTLDLPSGRPISVHLVDRIALRVGLRLEVRLP